MSGKKNNQKWILLLIFFLVVGIGATTMIYMDRIREFLPNDDGAIELITDSYKNAESKGDSEGGSGEDSGDSAEAGTANNETTLPTTGTAAGEAAGTETGNGGGNGRTVERGPVYLPDSEVSDDEQIWGQNTDVEIFRITYENDQQEVTVQSSNGEKVIAPGTGSSYTFKLKNSGNVALDYQVLVDMFTNLSETQIPLECRIQRFDGTWIVGGNDEWVSVDELLVTEDNFTVGSGRYTTYTLDWRWPFEAGQDELDTSLGNLAVEQDVTFTINIQTMAQISGNPDVTYGILPDTGDASNSMLYIILMGGSVLMILILLWYREREDEEADYE